MNRSKIKEFHYITPIENLPSILKSGILCHNRVKKVSHKSIAMSEIQERRENKELPNGKQLHDYVNLYFHARNPMMYKRKERHEGLCVLRIKPDILDVTGVVVADQNASSNYARFAPAPGGIENVDEKLTFAQDWNDLDPIYYLRRKSAKCAEVLVPEHVPPIWIKGGYVSCNKAFEAVMGLGLRLELTINPGLFFH